MEARATATPIWDAALPDLKGMHLLVVSRLKLS